MDVAAKKPGQDPGDQVDQEQKRKEGDLIRKVKVKSFTATPTAIEPFGSSTLQWSVTMPVSNDPNIQIGLLVDDEPVGAIGSKRVSPPFSKTFHLRAAGELASEVVASVTVSVNLAICQIAQLSPFELNAAATALAGPLFASSPEVKLKAPGVTATLGNFSVTLTVPMTIEVPNFFDADLDIAVTYGLFATDRDAGPGVNTQVVTTLQDVSVDAHWDLLAHVVSLGCTAIVQEVLERQATFFVRNLIAPSLGQHLRASVQEDAQRRLNLLNANTPAPSRFAFHSMTVSANGVDYRFCPS